MTRRESTGDFDPARYGPAVAALLTPLPLMDLGPGRPDAAARGRLQALDPARDFAAPVVNRDAASACVAGLWLLHDFWAESHAIAQDLHTPEGSYWHAIMHRREPDASNAKYWFRKVGQHPVIEQLKREAAKLGYDYKTPEKYVDYCELVRDGDDDLAIRVQRLEWDLLFEHCYRFAGD